VTKLTPGWIFLRVKKIEIGHYQKLPLLN